VLLPRSYAHQVFKTAPLVVSLIAVALGIAALVHTADWHVNATALSAVGSFSAAVVALGIATSDRRERKRERDAADKVEAKLVVVWGERIDGPSQLQVVVRNNGTRAIVDVTFVSLVVEDRDLDLRPTSESELPVVTPSGDDGKFIFNPEAHDPAHPFRRAMRGAPWPQSGPATILNSTKMTATVRWTDASGKTWVRSGAAPPLKLRKPVRIRI
jgi:hypothetical protein